MSSIAKKNYTRKRKHRIQANMRVDLLRVPFQEKSTIVVMKDREKGKISLQLVKSYHELNDLVYSVIQRQLQKAFVYSVFSDMNIDEKINFNKRLVEASENVELARNRYLEIHGDSDEEAPAKDLVSITDHIYDLNFYQGPDPVYAMVRKIAEAT